MAQPVKPRIEDFGELYLSQSRSGCVRLGILHVVALATLLALAVLAGQLAYAEKLDFPQLCVGLTALVLIAGVGLLMYYLALKNLVSLEQTPDVTDESRDEPGSPSTAGTPTQ